MIFAVFDVLLAVNMCINYSFFTFIWLSGNALVSINVVALRRAPLVLGWVTVHRYTISVFNQATKAYSAWPSLRG